MRHKKITAVAFALILGLSTMIPVNAAVATNSTKITERFIVTKSNPNGMASTWAALKNNSDKYMHAYANVTPNTIRWGTKEVLHVEGTTTINTPATYRGPINKPDDSVLIKYLPGHGTKNCHYGIRAFYPSSNGGTKLDVQVRWTP